MRRRSALLARAPETQDRPTFQPQDFAAQPDAISRHLEVMQHRAHEIQVHWRPYPDGATLYLEATDRQRRTELRARGHSSWGFPAFRAAPAVRKITAKTGLPVPTDDDPEPEMVPRVALHGSRKTLWLDRDSAELTLLLAEESMPGRAQLLLCREYRPSFPLSERRRARTLNAGVLKSTSSRFSPHGRTIQFWIRITREQEALTLLSWHNENIAQAGQPTFETPKNPSALTLPLAQLVNLQQALDELQLPEEILRLNGS